MERLLAVTANDHQETAMLKNRLEAVEAQRISNNVDLQARLERVRSKTKLRSLISFWYSDLKVVFVRDEMPWLVELGKRRCEWGREGDEGMFCLFFCLFVCVLCGFYFCTIDVLSEWGLVMRTRAYTIGSYKADDGFLAVLEPGWGDGEGEWEFGSLF